MIICGLHHLLEKPLNQLTMQWSIYQLPEHSTYTTYWALMIRKYACPPLMVCEPLHVSLQTELFLRPGWRGIQSRDSEHRLERFQCRLYHLLTVQP